VKDPSETMDIYIRSNVSPTATIAYSEQGKKQEYGRRTRQDKAREDKDARRPIEEED
jgi:hypothetical protein